MSAIGNGKVKILVELVLPQGVETEEAVAYVREAVKSWAGSLQPPGTDGGGSNPDAPGDPMFNLDAKTVKVRLWG
jgi:hypothetical protein